LPNTLRVSISMLSGLLMSDSELEDTRASIDCDANPAAGKRSMVLASLLVGREAEKKVVLS